MMTMGISQMEIPTNPAMEAWRALIDCFDDNGYCVNRANIAFVRASHNDNIIYIVAGSPFSGR
jgi:hypothetical protein